MLSRSLPALAVFLLAATVACGNVLVLEEKDAVGDGGAEELADGATASPPKQAEGSVGAPSVADGGADAGPDVRRPERPSVPEHCKRSGNKATCTCETEGCSIDCTEFPNRCEIECLGGITCRVQCKPTDRVTCRGQGTKCLVNGGCGCDPNQGAICNGS